MAIVFTLTPSRFASALQALLMVWTALTTPLLPEGGMSSMVLSNTLRRTPQMGKAHVDLRSVSTIGFDLATCLPDSAVDAIGGP